MNYLIVGASSVSGQGAIKAIQKKDQDHNIFGTTTSEKDVVNCQHTIKNINLDDSDAVSNIIKKIPADSIDYIFYIPARGKVGVTALDVNS